MRQELWHFVWLANGSKEERKIGVMVSVFFLLNAFQRAASRAFEALLVCQIYFYDKDSKIQLWNAVLLSPRRRSAEVKRPQTGSPVLRTHSVHCTCATCRYNKRLHAAHTGTPSDGLEAVESAAATPLVSNSWSALRPILGADAPFMPLSS